MMLLTSLADALAKLNKPSCERFFSISSRLGCGLNESMIRFSISLTVNDGSIAPSFEGIFPEVLWTIFL